MAVIVFLILFIFLGYIFNWSWTGLRQQTLWNWLQLLIIPAVLLLTGSLFTFTVSRNERKAADRRNQIEREIAQDNQHGAILQEYIDKMSELILDKNLCNSTKEPRTIARVRTLTVLSLLDAYRKRSVIQFLQEVDLIKVDKTIVDLSGADLTKAFLSALNLASANFSRTILFGAELMGTNLTDVNLSNTTLLGANLTSANLMGANLKETSISLNYPGAEPIITKLYMTDLTDADLSGARLRGANLRDTILIGADLTGADLRGAKITNEQLAKAKSLKGATLPDGSIHP
jgi:uncharacterized protein YjbI with pentapeptide repeats